MSPNQLVLFCVCLVSVLECLAADSGYMEVGQYCLNDSDCHFSASCVSNTCKCKANYVANARVNKCLGGTGQDCRYDDDCIPHAYCQQQVKCACMDGLKASADGMTCEGTVSSRIMNTSCTTDADCVRYGEGATCDNKLGECKCNTSQHFLDGRCYTIKKLGEQCSSTNECYVVNHPQRAVCNDTSHRCECKSGYKPSADNSDCDVGVAVQVTSMLLLVSMFMFSKVIVP